MPSEDAHQSEYTAEPDKRREWITKYVTPRFQLEFVLRNTHYSKHSFTGSAGQAIISKTAAYLVTDSRYWLQAEKELDENWVLIRAGAAHGPRNWVDWVTVSVSPSIVALGRWLTSFTHGKDRANESRVGIDARMLSNEIALQLYPLLQAKKSKLVYPSQNLIDLVWLGKPTRSKNKIYVQPIEYTGELPT